MEVSFRGPPVPAVRQVRFTSSSALGGILSLALLTAGSVARAQQECGTPANGVVTCGAAGNPYAQGISYSTAQDLSLRTNADTVVTRDVTVTGTGAANVVVSHNGTVAIEAGFDPYGLNNGIDARAGGGMVTVDATGQISVSGTEQTTESSPTGVFAQGLGQVTVMAHSIDARGLSARGIFAGGVGTSTAPATTNIAIDSGTVSVSGYGGDGISADGRSADTVTIRSTSITASGGATAINVFSDDFFGKNTAVSVDSGSIVATDDFGRGIAVTGGSGLVAIRSDSVSTAGQYGTGITLDGGTANTGVNSIVSRLVQTSGGGANGIDADAAGDLSITSDTVTTAGSESQGISAGSSGNLTITSGTVSTTGPASLGIEASGYAASMTINSGTVTTTGPANFYQGSDAIRALDYGNGAITIRSGIARTQGDRSAGVIASSGGDVTITATTVSTAGEQSTGIFGGGNTASVTTEAGGSVSTLGYYSPGIWAEARNGATVVASGSISTRGNMSAAIYATTDAGIASITAATLATAGDDAAGAYAQGDSATVVANGDVTTAGRGSPGLAAVASTGDASVTANGTVRTAGTDAAGITALSDGGIARVVHNGAVTVGTQGIRAIGENGVSITGNGAVFAGGRGIYAESASGPVSIATGAVTTSSTEADAITGISRGSDVALIVNGPITTAGDDARGVRLRAFGSVVANVGDVTTSGVNQVTIRDIHAIGIIAEADRGDVKVSAGAVSTAGYGAIGVLATSDFSTTTVTTGAVTTIGEGAIGIHAQGGGGVSVKAGVVSTSGASSDGVIANGETGPTTVTVASVAATGAGSVGVFAIGAGPVAVTAGAASSSTMAAVVARSGASGAAVALNGAATGGGGTALTISGATTASLTLGNTGALTAAGGNAQLLSTTGAFVSNQGTIAGDARGPILSATGGPLAFVNASTFTGTIGFTDGADSVTNTGIYRASFSQDFGGGIDAFINAGTMLLPSNGTGARRVAFTNLENFNNAGLVDLRNGIAGDVLSTSSTFSGGGGSTLGIDLALGGATPVADRLVVAGAITGSTVLVVNVLNGAPALTPGIVFARGGAGTSPTAFSIASPAASGGLVRYAVAFDAAAGSFALVGTPGDTVARALKVNEGAQQLWYRSADTVATHLVGIRDAHFGGYAQDGGKFWTEMYGQDSRRDSQQTITAFGVSRVADTGYAQDTFGGQIGFDLGHGAEADGVSLGVTGGYQSSDVNFARSVDRAHFDAANVGVSASFQVDGLFIDALGKFDYYWLRVNGGDGRLSDRLHGRSYGAQGEAGYRFGSERFYVEPIATLAYVRTDLDRLRAPNASVNFEDLDGLRGKAGARIGGRLDLGGGSIMVAYAQGNYVHEFKGRDGVFLDSGGLSVGLRNRELPDYSEGRIGFSVGRPGGVNGFVEGFGQDGRAYKGGGGRAGLKITF